uniref:Uncharacterized protein n=1 Tax=Anguilla anguilla TaxID=7936 RepID=A0A0E9SDE2_ANGAN
MLKDFSFMFPSDNMFSFFTSVHYEATVIKCARIDGSYSI